MKTPRRSTGKFLSAKGLSSIASLALLLPVSGMAREPDLVLIRHEEVIPISKPGTSSGETVYLESAVAKTTPTKSAPLPPPTPKPKTTPAVTPFKSRTDAPITVLKSSHPSKGTASSQDEDWDAEYSHSAQIADPIQPVNRGVFWFNHQLYHYVFTPLNKTYKFVLPRPARKGISNAINNIEYPVRFVNDLLQWKPERAGLETEKFVINSTAGIGGLFKVSDKFPKLAEVKPTDTSATFAKWGIPPGCYIVWPVLGPKSVRDTVGFAGDVALNPASWFTYGVVGGLTGPTALAISAPQTAGNTSDKLDTYETITKHSVDPYLSVRSAYVQNRKKVESH